MTIYLNLNNFETIKIDVWHFSTVIKGVNASEEDETLPNNRVDYTVYVDHSHSYLTHFSQCCEVTRARVITKILRLREVNSNSRSLTQQLNK